MADIIIQVGSVAQLQPRADPPLAEVSTIQNMYFVYFIKSIKNNKVYVGVTSKDPIIRLLEHNNGSSKFTSQNSPLELVYFEKYICKDDAYSRERFYKSGFGRNIRDLIVKYTNIKDL